MINPRIGTALGCTVLLSASASGQFFAPGFDSTLYGITPDVAQASAVADALGALAASPGGSAFDGQFLYVENFNDPSQLLQIDPASGNSTVLNRAYQSGLPATDNLAADANGVLWEIEAGVLYSLSIDASGNVNRNAGVPLSAGGASPLSVGDLAWGPDGLLYISSMQGNFTWDPASGVTTLLSGPDFFIGLAWFEDKLYGSIGDGFVRGLLPLDASMNAGKSYLFAFGAAGFTDLASFNGGGSNEPDCVDTGPYVATGGSQTLWAGQHIDAGTVDVEIAGDRLVVTYNTANGWSLDEVHLWVGLDTADMPQNNKGNPKIGHFPNSDSNLGGLTSLSYEFALADLGISCPPDPDSDASDRQIYVAAHAVVSNGSGGSETAWGDGSRFVSGGRGRGSWATYSTITYECGTQCDNPNPVEQACETAYASEDPLDIPEAICFFDLDENGNFVPDANFFEAWGWTIFIPHTDNDGFYTFPIYARASDCDPASGVKVGELWVTYDVPPDVTTDLVTVQATYVMFDGYEIDELYFYQGAEPVPVDLTTGELSLALANFPVAVDNFSGYSDADLVAQHVVDFVWDPIVSYVNGQPQFQGVHIIANASVCGTFPVQQQQ